MQKNKEEIKRKSQKETTASPNHFIRKLVSEDLKKVAQGGHLVTRFPPEPNGYLHIGHAKSICLNFELAREFEGRCHMRFDDTNPSSETAEYVSSILEDVRWLGYDWGEHLYNASDQFPPLYDLAIKLIQLELAYVCDLSSEEIFQKRGTLTEPGENSPYRDRSIEENLTLFEQMKAGAFAPGKRVLRAKIDMASSILPMRDPILYRIVDTPHHRTGRDWSIYPMYDFAHCLTDALEGVTHSFCTLEFTDHRPLYDWLLEKLDFHDPPKQTEFARLNLSHTVLSKRILKQLVERGHVSGWDDPRMPTISGLRRRGYTPKSIRDFCEGIGVAKRDSTIQMARLEFSVREHLNSAAPRAMAVLNPLKVIITNYPEASVEKITAINNPEDELQGTREVPFTREIWIEREDFLENPPKKFFRLAPGREVRLRYAYLVTCQNVLKNADGEITEVHCTYDPETRGGNAPDGRRVKGTIHWVSTSHAHDAEIRLFDVLFNVEDPMTSDPNSDFTAHLNPGSVEIVKQAKLEPSLMESEGEQTFQFERMGYFIKDRDSTAERSVWNRTVTLRDTWAKTQTKAGRKI
jgi:glutaminyl-tRNA synthetase